jgi:hypothetical protein
MPIVPAGGYLCGKPRQEKDRQRLVVRAIKREMGGVPVATAGTITPLDLEDWLWLPVIPSMTDGTRVWLR